MSRNTLISDAETLESHKTEPKNFILLHEVLSYPARRKARCFLNYTALQAVKKSCHY